MNRKMTKRKPKSRAPSLVMARDPYLDRRIEILALKKKEPVNVQKKVAELREKMILQDANKPKPTPDMDIISRMQVKATAVPKSRGRMFSHTVIPPEETIVCDSSDDDNDVLMTYIQVKALVEPNNTINYTLPINLPKKPNPPISEAEEDRKRDLKMSYSVHDIPKDFNCFVKIDKLEVKSEIPDIHFKATNRSTTNQVEEDLPMVSIPEVAENINAPIAKEETQETNDRTINHTECAIKKETLVEAAQETQETYDMPNLDDTNHPSIRPEHLNSTTKPVTPITVAVTTIKSERVDLRANPTPPLEADNSQSQTVNELTVPQEPMECRSPPPYAPAFEPISPPHSSPERNAVKPMIKVRNINEMLANPPQPRLTVIASNPFADSEESVVNRRVNTNQGNMQVRQNPNMQLGHELTASQMLQPTANVNCFNQQQQAVHYQQYLQRGFYPQQNLNLNPQTQVNASFRPTAQATQIAPNQGTFYINQRPAQPFNVNYQTYETMCNITVQGYPLQMQSMISRP